MKARAELLTGLLEEAAIDVLLVTDLINVRYLTGYTGSNGLALIGSGTRSFLTDFRYIEQAAEEVHPSFERARASQDLLDAIGDVLPDGPLRLGFDDAHVPVREHRRLRSRLDERVELVAAGGLVERLRAVKEPEEVEAIRLAAKLADAALERLLREGLLGRTERELALALEQDMRERGAQRASFDSIVASGPHGALPHARPRDEPVRRGELVVVDWGALLDGYCSDCTRTLAAGDPGSEAQEMYELVFAAQQVGLQAVYAGVHGRDADAAARAVIANAGQVEYFGHGLGHGVGLDIHEAPRLSQRSQDTLQAGNIVTVEPGVYLPGKFGIRIEDLVLVTEDGCEILTSVTKRLMVVD
ncbi:MAG: M24 family metallopeptidase [Solirubrobacteraceae bacterium]